MGTVLSADQMFVSNKLMTHNTVVKVISLSVLKLPLTPDLWTLCVCLWASSQTKTIGVTFL